MSQVCSICNNPNRIEIDRQIVEGISHQRIARQFDVDGQSIWRHSQNHLSRQLVQAYQKKELAVSMDLMNRIENIISKAQDIFTRNYEAKKDDVALRALSEQRATFELLCKIAAYWHETRAMELQSTQGDYESRRKEEVQENAKRACERLNDAEFNLFCKLLAKIDGETDEDIIPCQETQWPKYKPEKDPEPIPDEPIQEPTKEPIKRTRHPLSVQPLEPTMLEPYSEKTPNLKKPRIISR